MSSGEMVPEVMTTEENRSNTGAIAMEGSRQLEAVNIERRAAMELTSGERLG
jgi:hypothetical protein